MEGGELKRQRRESSIQVTQGDATIIVQDSVAQIFFVLLLCVSFFSRLFFLFFFFCKKKSSVFFSSSKFFQSFLPLLF